jgi:hypothetical protein
VTDDVFPDRNMDHLDKLSWVIEDQGWVAVPVDAREGPPPRGAYAYTIGFTTTFGRPEVAIFGLQAVAARGLLGMIADQHAGGVELPVGAVFVGLLENDLPCALLPIDLDEHGDLFPDAAALLGRTGEPWELLQFVWPDRNGRLPWDAEYDQRLRVAQPIVGSTAA